MADLYRVIGWAVNGNLIVHNYKTLCEAIRRIREMKGDIEAWENISFEVFDGFDQICDATIWERPFGGWGVDD